NPEYLAKSYFPKELLESIGLETIGSRTRRITPEKRSRDRIPEEVDTTELFLRGPRKAIRRWAKELSNWEQGARDTDEIVSIEQLHVPQAIEKLKEVPTRGKVLFEVVLHVGHPGSLDGQVAAFRTYLRNRNIPAPNERRFSAGGLCFLEIEAAAHQAREIAQFTMVRAVRKMPDLRIPKPAIKAVGIESTQIELPKSGPL